MPSNSQSIDSERTSPRPWTINGDGSDFVFAGPAPNAFQALPNWTSPRRKFLTTAKKKLSTSELMPSKIDSAVSGGAAIRLCSGLGHLARLLPAFRGKSRLCRTVASKMLAGRRRAVVRVDLPDGCRLLLDPRGRTEAQAFYHGLLDCDDLDFFRCCVGNNSVALDIGANIGLVSIPLGRHLKSLHGRLICFEPVATNVQRLRANATLNEFDATVTIIQCALGRTECEMQIGREASGGAETGNALLNPGSANNGEMELTTTRVRRLDDVAAELKLDRLDFAKIDVEGAELEVLHGGIETIKRFRPILYGEFNSGLMPRFGGSFVDVGKLMSPLGYRALAFKHRLDLEFVEYTAGRGNAVLCPEEKAEALLQRCTAERESA
jgi:FkbM family methyltransferase